MLVIAGSAQAGGRASVSAVHGNIVCANGAKSSTLSREGKDEEPVLSPDGHTVVFVRVLVQQVPYEMFTKRSALWLGDCRDLKTRVLVPSVFSLEPASGNLGDPGAPHFSRDGRFVYFSTSATPTDGAVHRVNVRTGKERFIAYGGGDLRVFISGPYRDNILTRQHACHETSGCGYPFYIFSPKGREIAQIPQSEGWDEQALRRWLMSTNSEVQ
ncbi:hypothetical protein AEAC466_19140 [Asticcacaulis sp. AC466]|nr:hypothetical protein AEAC466_19140 [Asticcacaulis sp. AC466]